MFNPSLRWHWLITRIYAPKRELRAPNRVKIGRIKVFFEILALNLKVKIFQKTSKSCSYGSQVSPPSIFAFVPGLPLWLHYFASKADTAFRSRAVISPSPWKYRQLRSHFFQSSAHFKSVTRISSLFTLSRHLDTIR